MKHFVICVTISHNNRFNFKHVSQNFFTYCRVNPYFPEKLNDVATIQSFVQIFQFSINSTKNVLIDKMAVLCVIVKKKACLLFFFLSVDPPEVTGLTVACFSCNKDCEPLSSLSTNRHCGLERKASSGNNGVFDNLPLIFCELNFKRINTESFIIVVRLNQGWIYLV